MDMEFIKQRITELRLNRGISEYALSYEAGHSKNYVHNIVSGYSQPSVPELLYLIELLGVSPRDFFDEEQTFKNPQLVQQIIDGIKDMNDSDLAVILLMVERLQKKEP